MMYFISTWNWK